jgi:hypothetical protein
VPQAVALAHFSWRSSRSEHAEHSQSSWLEFVVCRTTGIKLRGPERSEGHVSFNDLVGQRPFHRLAA